MSPLFDIVAAEIDARGAMAFSRYMELALYHPELGFYAAGGAGRRRDFITSPEVGPLFGAVMANAIDHWWREAGRPDEFVVVDAGAGPGALARTVLRCDLECASALRYLTVESSTRQRELHPVGCEPLAEMPTTIESGVVIANELLDNLPFDIVSSGHDGQWHEVRIGHDNGVLVELLVPADVGELDLPEMVGETRMPVQRSAQRWLRDALASLQHGRVVVVDYAVPRYPVPADRQWLRTYTEHGDGGSPLDHPGAKDITADVDLASLGVIAPPAVTTQADWLRRHGIDALVEAGQAHWAEHAARPDLLAMEMRSRSTEAMALLDPAGLGGFTVAEWLVG